MGGAMSRNKGKTGEYELRDFLRAWWPGAQRGANQSRSGSEAADVEGTPFWTEAKLGAKPNVRAAIAQAQEATDGRPILIYVRDDRKQPFFTLDAASMASLLTLAYGCPK